jgi:hypothetical protein
MFINLLLMIHFAKYLFMMKNIDRNKVYNFYLKKVLMLILLYFGM